MRALLLIVLVLLPTAAQSQSFSLDLSPTFGSRTSPSPAPAAHRAFGYATDYMHTELACRHGLPSEQRTELVEAAIEVYLAAGYSLDGAGIALRELERSIGGRASWAQDKCVARFLDFLERQEHDLRAVAELAAQIPEK